MQPVEAAIRSRFTPPESLRTFGRGSPFVLDRFRPEGLVLLLGAKQNYTPIAWPCIEGIVAFLEAHPGWLNAGGTYETSGESGTLDEYLKGCIARQTSRWVVVVLVEAGIVDVDKGPPLRIRLRRDFAAAAAKSRV